MDAWTHEDRAATAPFHPWTRAWLEASFPRPTRVQIEGWARIARGEHALLLAPTGSGKTLAAFLWCLDRLSALPRDAAPGVRAVYVSPLKALVHDIEKNLRAPLVGLERAAERLGATTRPVRVGLRTGDTPAKERRDLLKLPPDVLVTTPESLFLLLGSKQARPLLSTVEWVIVDEVHALAPSKRGAHLAVSLERLAELAARDPQRIGLSATVEPPDEVARLLGGDRAVTVVDARERPRLSLVVEAPSPTESEEPQASRRSEGPLLSLHDGDEPARPQGAWDRLAPRLLEQVLAHRSTIVFVNSRIACERLTRRLNELAVERGGAEVALAHHGSLAPAQRAHAEERLKGGSLRAIVATSSLELGIDMGAVDLVLLVDSPGSVARGLQRVGRAGHAVGETSVARLFPRMQLELVEAAAVAAEMKKGAIEAVRVTRRCLDVLAQQVAAIVATEDRRVDDVERLVRRSEPFRELPREAFVAVLDMLSGRYPAETFPELRPLIVWDRAQDVLRARRGAKALVALNAGTIPDRGAYAVHLAEGGPRLGELDEEMVFETRRGDTFVLGASTWRVLEVGRDRVIVEPAPGQPGKLPFWRGPGPGRPVELGRAIGALLRALGPMPPAEARAWLSAEHGLDDAAAASLVELVRAQAAAGAIPDDRTVVVERFEDELGDWRVCLLTPFGGRVHAPWAQAIEAELRRRGHETVEAVWTDDGVALRLPGGEAPPGLDALLPDPDALEDVLVDAVRGSALFAASFREAAARALVLPRRRFGARQPLWAQRLKAESLRASALEVPSFPLVLEALRECLQDRFDVPALRELLRGMRAQEVRVVELETARPSPMARALSNAYAAAFVYQGDAPLAERRAQALAVDRELLRELLGPDAVRDLLDPGVIDEVEAELQGLAPERRAAHGDALHDLLRRVGDLGDDELALRATEPPRPWLDALERERRAARIRIAGETRWIAVEDAARYRDALGALLPKGLPAALLEPAADALEGLVVRFARSRGPFQVRALAERLAISPRAARDALVRLERRGLVVRGELRPGARGEDWCHRDVLRELRRRTLARLRREVAPVDGAAYARFLTRWQGARAEEGPEQTSGAGRLRDVIEQLEGVALPLSVFEHEVLPARVPGYRPALLDDLASRGEVVWVGRGALGPRDGRIALYTRAHARLLVDPPDPLDDDPSLALARALLEQLHERGASFFLDLHHALDHPPTDELALALWELAWRGLVTNDALHPLRALAARAAGPRRRRPGRDVVQARVAGRWSTVRSLGVDATPSTERAHARAMALLARHGVVSRETAAAEGVPGGFARLLDVLDALEEGGRVRRGNFVDGLTGAQFATAAAVDVLRNAREEPDAARVLSVLDPANPWGALLPWPAAGEGAAKPRRGTGRAVVLVGGRPLLLVEPDLKGIATFAEAGDPRALGAALEALVAHALRRGRDVELLTIDGEAARRSPLAPRLVELGFTHGYRGLSLAARSAVR